MSIFPLRRRSFRPTSSRWTAYCLAAILGALLPQAGSAQVAWDAPLLLPPRAAPGWGIALVDPSPRSDLAVMGSWRGSTSPIGFRIGIADGPRNDGISVYGGLDFAGGLLRRTGGNPFDLDWVAGAGIGVGDAVLLAFPLGLSMGSTFQADGVAFGPYLTPRVVLDAWMGDDRPRNRDGLRLGLAVDLGFDLAFDPSWTIRFGATLGDREALAIGVAFR